MEKPIPPQTVTRLDRSIPTTFSTLNFLKLGGEGLNKQIGHAQEQGRGSPLQQGNEGNEVLKTFILFLRAGGSSKHPPSSTKKSSP